MTTNHRPTLENKRGKDAPIKDSILHARALNGHSQMKLRPDIKGAKLPEPKTLESTKTEQVDRSKEVESKRSATRARSDSDSDPDSSDSSDSESELQAELDKLRQNKLPEKPKPAWRKTAFRQNNSSSQKSAFTTDSLRSDTHKNFMSKYFR